MSVRDTWKKPRRRCDHFKTDERAHIRECFRRNVPPLEVAQRLRCSVRSIQARYAKYREAKWVEPFLTAELVE